MGNFEDLFAGKYRITIYALIASDLSSINKM